MNHRWGEPNRMAQKTERECLRGCRTIRVTFHQGGRHWIEFWRDGEKCEGSKTPGCDPALKPRGNNGIVSAQICFNALHLVGNVTLPTAMEVASWPQDRLDRTYDWAMRIHLAASDNNDVVVPPRPDWLCDRWAP